MQDWILLALVSHVLFAGSAVIDKVLRIRHLKDSESMMVLMSFLQSAPIVALPFLDYGGIGLIWVLASLFSGFLAVIPYWLYAESIKDGEISRIAPLWQTIPVFVVIMAYLILGERLPILFYLAFIFVLVGGLLFSVRKGASILNPDKKFWMMILASFMFAVQVIILKFAYENAGFWQVTALLCAGRVITGGGLLVLPNMRRKFVESMHATDWRVVLASFIISTVAILTYTYALFLGSPSIVEVLSGVNPLFVLFFATLLETRVPGIIEEKVQGMEIASKAVAGALMFIGLALLYV